MPFFLRSESLKSPAARWFVLILFLGLLAGCVREDRLEPVNELTGQTITQNLRVKGHEFESLLIENCLFEGATLNIGDADFVTVRNCEFRNIDGNALKVGFIGPASNILIDGCTFENIGFNGVDSHENAPNGVVRNCIFKKCAQSEVGAAMGQPHHAIYWKGQNVQIIGNDFDCAEHRFGNGISHRSSGIIARNRVFGSPKYGIMYYADHPGSDSLTIENNFVQACRSGIGVNSSGNLDFHNENIELRFNTVFDSGEYGVYVAKDFENTAKVRVYGNLLLASEKEAIRTFYTVETFGNLVGNDGYGLLDPENRDLHLTAISPAIGYCDSLPNFPLTDIDGDARPAGTLDAGADERF